MNHIRHAALQKKLDFLDEQIDSVDREKLPAGDLDLPQDIEEAKEVQQMAREDWRPRRRGDTKRIRRIELVKLFFLCWTERPPFSNLHEFWV